MNQELNQERMNIVIVGHVDHGKSTVIGRLLADTGSLPEGKLEQVKAMCLKTARPFEYAFLLDALADEQDQGITIDAARCFFKSKKRHYIVLDAPGHIEFLKNMVTGAANAEAALLVIDAKEGVQENSKRHGYLVSMLGIKKVVVVVNKMDLVGYAQASFENTVAEYGEFLKKINLEPVGYIPIAAREGDHMVGPSVNMPWHKGHNILSQLDDLIPEDKEAKLALPLRFPVQDIYKFTESGDDRRIFAGTIETGTAQVGQAVTFWPSGKTSKIASIEQFNCPASTQAKAGQALGFTLETQIYVQPGEIMVASGEAAPIQGRRFRANIFWMSKAPLILGKNYKLKLATKRVNVRLVEVLNVLDASELTSVKGKNLVERHDLGECIFETLKPIAYDLAAQIDATGRFVLVDNFEIAGGGIVLESIEIGETVEQAHVRERESRWESGHITPELRAQAFLHRAKFVLITGQSGAGKRKVAMALEKRLFLARKNVYYLSHANLNQGLTGDIKLRTWDRAEEIRRLGELARLMTDAGQIFITALSEVDDYDLEQLRTLNAPHEILVVHMGDNPPEAYKPDLILEPGTTTDSAVNRIQKALSDAQVLEFYI